MASKSDKKFRVLNKQITCHVTWVPFGFWNTLELIIQPYFLHLNSIKIYVIFNLGALSKHLKACPAAGKVPPVCVIFDSPAQVGK